MGDQGAEAQNLYVIAARLGVDVAKANVKIAESGHMPTVDLFAQYGQYNRDATQTNQRSTGGHRSVTGTGRRQPDRRHLSACR